METGFSADFSGVRVHTGPLAHRLATGLHARALTAGSNVYFGAGAFRPGTAGGDRLLAHELAHVVQQRYGLPRAAIDAGPHDPLERSADKAAERALRTAAPDTATARAAAPDTTRSTDPASLGARQVQAKNGGQQSEGASVTVQRFTSEPNCSSYLDALTAADAQANALVENAIACLSMSPPPPWVDKALLDYFSISASNQNKDDLVAAILGVYGQLSSHFAAGDYDYNCSCSWLCPRKASGCTDIGAGPIELCVENLSSIGGIPLAGPGVIVHELSHRFAGTDDLSYCPTVSCRDLTSGQAIGNAESYKMFALQAWTENPPVGPPAP